MRRRLARRLAVLFLLAGCANWLPARSASAAEVYYIILFGSERETRPKPLQYTHTWATFVKTVGEGPVLSQYTVAESFTISWLPATLKVRVHALHGEPGVNLDMVSTINYVTANQETIDVWGPYMVLPMVYTRAIEQYNSLLRGNVLYRAIDTAFDPRVSDCIHAVSAVDPEFGRSHYPLIRVGKPATRYLAHNLYSRSIYDQRLYDNRWLLSRLGLTAYPILFHTSQTPP